MFGYSGRAELYASLTDVNSAADADVSLSELGARVKQYMAEIEKENFDQEQAWDLICEVKAGPWLGVSRFMSGPTDMGGELKEDLRAVMA